MKLQLIIIFLLFSLTISCGDNKSTKEIEFYSAQLDKLPLKEETKWVIILPGLGCTGCIQEAEFFMQQYISNPKLFFVLTKVESLKILQYKTGIDFSKYDNLYIDRDSDFNLPFNNSIYPAILKLKNSKIEYLEFQSPDNNPFSKLELML